jgi:hypothetical protein
MASKAKRLPQPPDRPEIVPSDLLFLECIKKNADYNCASLPGFLKRIAEIFSQIEKAMLISVFESWIK